MKLNKISVVVVQSIFVLFAAAPLIFGFGYALLYSFGLIGVLNEGFTIVHWERLLFESNFWGTLLFSLVVALVTMGLSLFFALLVVVAWYKNLERGALSYIVYLPLAFPGVVMAFYTFQLLSKSGFLSRLLYNLGITNGLNDFPDLINDAYGIGIIFSLLLLITPFFILLYANMYRNERIQELTELASTLGAKPIQITLKVVLPVLLKKSAFTIVLFVIFVMGTYEIPLLLGRQNPSMFSPFVINKLQKFNLNDIPQAYAISILYILLIALLIGILFWKLRGLFIERATT